MFGTKCPSMTSTWITVPPPRSAAATSSANRAKSAESIDGSNSTMDAYEHSSCPVSVSANARPCSALRGYGRLCTPSDARLLLSIRFNRIRPRARIAGVPLRLRRRSISRTSGSIAGFQRVRPASPCIAQVFTMELRSSSHDRSTTAVRSVSATVSAMRGTINARFQRSLFSVASTIRPRSVPSTELVTSDLSKKLAPARPRRDSPPPRLHPRGIRLP